MTNLLWPSIIALLVMFVLMLSGFHVAVALGLVAVAASALTFGFDAGFGLLLAVPYTTVFNFALTAVPLFLLMGDFTVYGGIGEDLYMAVYKLMGRLPGSLAMATSLAAAFFGACSGSTLASVSIFTRLAYPEMKKYGYKRGFALACIASVSGFAVIIPPSIVIVVYGVITGTSIGKTLIAGFIPGFLLAFFFMAMIYVRARLDPSLCPRPQGEPEPWKERLAPLKGIWAVLVLAALILGGIYFGVFTPTEAAGIGAAGALLLALVRRRMTWSRLSTSLLETARASSMIFIIVIGASLLARFLALTGFLSSFIESVSNLPVPPVVIMVIFIGMYTLLGCIMDGLSMLIVTLPFVFPVVVNIGYDPVWFGIVCAMLVGLAVITPPVGMDVFAVKAIVGDEVALEDIFHSVAFFAVLYLIAIFVLIFFPQIVLWLPSMME